MDPDDFRELVASLSQEDRSRIQGIIQSGDVEDLVEGEMGLGESRRAAPSAEKAEAEYEQQTKLPEDPEQTRLEAERRQEQRQTGRQMLEPDDETENGPEDGLRYSALPREISPEQVSVNLSASTDAIPGLGYLTRLAESGDVAAGLLVSDIARDAMDALVSGIPGVVVESSPKTGLYGGKLEPSLGAVVRFTKENRQQVLAAIEQFARKFVQEQVHVRGEAPPGAELGHQYEDGSYATRVVEWKLTRQMSRAEIEAVAKESGLYGFTVGENSLLAYFVGDPNNQHEIREFIGSSRRAQSLLRGSVERTGERVERLWVYGSGATPYARIRGEFPAPKTETLLRYAQRIAARIAGRDLTPARPARTITPAQARLQTRIAEAYGAMRMNALDDPRVRRAYEELVIELKEQFRLLPVQVLLVDRNPYPNSRAMMEDVARNGVLKILRTDANTFGPPGIIYRDHPLLRDSGFQDGFKQPVLNNDLLRAVHDYYAHTMGGGQFGPLGEESAWLNHMMMTRSPWARWALTSETRGQNSFVNFGPNSEHNRTHPDDTIYAEQKVDLLPPEFALTGLAWLDAEFRKISGLGGMETSPINQTPSFSALPNNAPIPQLIHENNLRQSAALRQSSGQPGAAPLVSSSAARQDAEAALAGIGLARDGAQLVAALTLDSAYAACDERDGEANGG